MKQVLKKLEEIKDEQNGFIAIEAMSGNVVKKEFSKGAVFALNMAIDIIIDEIENGD